MSTLQESDEKHLIFKDQFKHCSSEKSLFLPFGQLYWFWSNRLVLINNFEEEDDNEFWNFTAFDLLMNETKQIRFKKSGYNFTSICIYSLNGEFGLIVEKSDFHSCVHLVKLDWNLKEVFQPFHDFKSPGKVFIFVDKMDPSKFAFQCDSGYHLWNYHSCKLVNDKIEVGKGHQRYDLFDHFSNDKLIRLKYWDVTIFDLTSNKDNTFSTDQSLLFPGNIHVQINCCKFIGDYLYVIIITSDAFEHKIAWLNLATEQWNSMKLKINQRIDELGYCNDHLVAFIKNSEKISDSKNIEEIDDCYEIEIKAYDVATKRPHHLRYSTWILVINIMKNKGEKDPYKSAKKYLPLNSDLREAWFKNEEKVGQ